MGPQGFCESVYEHDYSNVCIYTLKSTICTVATNREIGLSTHINKLKNAENPMFLVFVKKKKWTKFINK